MAVPTITSCSPSTGLTRGRNIIFVNGTNFRTPPEPVGYDPGDAQQTIKVTFDGVASTEAHSLSATKAIVQVPAWAGEYNSETPGSVDVVISNLDNNGDVIAGETATLADGYTYERPDIVSRATSQRITQALVELLRRNVITNVTVGMTTAYADDFADDLDAIKMARLPLIEVGGPDLIDSPRWGIACEEEEDDPSISDMYTRKEVARTTDISYPIRIWVDNRNNVNALHAIGKNILMCVRDAGYITIDSDREHTMLIPADGVPAYDTSAQLDGLATATMRIIVKGVQIDDIDGTIIERGYDIYDTDGSEVTSETHAG